MAKRKKKSTTSKKAKKTVRRQNASTPTTRGGTRNRKGRGSDNDSHSSIPDIPNFDSFPEPSSHGRSIRKLPKPNLSSLPSLPKLSVPKFKKPKLKKPNIKFSFNPHRKALILGLVLILITLLVTLALFSTNRGLITGNVIDFLWSLFGWGMPVSLLATIGLGFWLVSWGLKNAQEFPIVRVLGGLALFFTFETFMTLITVLRDNGVNTFDAVLQAQLGGGWLGYLAAQTMLETIGVVGAVFVLCIIGIGSAVFVSGMSWQDVSLMFQPKPAATIPAITGTAKQPPLPFLQRFRQKESAPPTGAPVTERQNAYPPETTGDEVLPWVEPAAPAGTPDLPIEGEGEGEGENEAKREKAKPEKKNRLSRRGRKAKKAEQTPEAEPPVAPEPLVLGRAPQVQTAPDTPAPSWERPTLEILRRGSEQSTDDTYIHQQALIIEETLTGFGAPAQVVGFNKGPTIVQYCVEPKYLVQKSGKRTKVKVGKIASLADDLSLALAARSVRIQAPVPGKGYVGIEVPNESKALVSLRDVMESKAFNKIGKKTTLTIGLGEDVSGQSMSIDLAKMPHMLIAGATGSGKSVCINALIACLLLQNSPEQLQLVMVDPKRVELTGYNGIPHLAAPVVVDMERVTGTLQWALREMDNRYKQFANIGVRNITEYNKTMKRQKKKSYPFVVIIIDELADLMMLAPDETEKSIARLAQMARATGIHMILATQRPSVDVVTGLIKANFPARIAFAVASSTDSRVVLDSTGAERLLGQGDMLFQSPDAPAPVRMQGCFVSDEELNDVIEYWKNEKRRAMGMTEEGRQVHLRKAATEKVSKSALNHDIWDVDPAEEKRRKDAALAQIKKDSAERAPYIPTAHTQEFRPLSKPAVKEKAKSTPKPKQEPESVKPSATAVPMKTEKPADPEPTTKPNPEYQPPLWEELREEVELAQEEAIYDKNTFHDDLWDEAVEFVQTNNKASISLLQRKYRIGYTRAARLIDRMEEEQIIGPPTGNSKARVVAFSGANDAEKDSNDNEIESD